VAGRSLTIVKLQNGAVQRIFARKADFPNDGSSINLNLVTDTPFDSPLTGTPIVYPLDVGADATKVFVGDADGTIWRFDLSDPNPANWSASVFLDLYNQTVDPPGTRATWADGQPLEVDPVLSLDPSSRLVLSAATGTTEQFDNTGLDYLYSITEQPNATGSCTTGNSSAQTCVNAFVNWVLGPSSSPSGFRAGERVAGPMTVFNGTLYFATYYAGDPSVASCTSGDARIWGMDFVNPYTVSGAGCAGNTDPACRANGGVYSADVAADVGYVDVGTTNPGVVVPGVAVQETPACGSVSASTFAGGGSHTSIGSLGDTSKSFQLVGMLAGKMSGGLPATKTVQLSTPIAPTLIDSWASVLE
jgi:type IV pilus assembly protein PilY1